MTKSRMGGVALVVFPPAALAEQIVDNYRRAFPAALLLIQISKKVISPDR